MWKLEGDRGAGARESRGREAGGERADNGIPKVSTLYLFLFSLYNKKREK